MVLIVAEPHDIAAARSLRAYLKTGEVMDGNGQNDGRSRLDRIEAALELMIQDHEEFRAEHKMLLKSQVLMQDSSEKEFAKFRQRMDEMEGKLNGVIGVVDQLSRVVVETSREVAETGRVVAQTSLEVAEFSRNVESMRQNFDTRLQRLEGPAA
ncbi:MAG: hypothetical protein ACKV22_21630 [Bryobacteraceae bacterium]